MLGASSQILGGAWTAITANFQSGTIFWGIILLIDFAIAAYRYHKTREISEFIKTVLLMIIITVGVGLIIAYVTSTS